MGVCAFEFLFDSAIWKLSPGNAGWEGFDEVPGYGRLGARGESLGLSTCNCMCIINLRVVFCWSALQLRF